VSVLVEEFHESTGSGRHHRGAYRSGFERDDAEGFVQGRHHGYVRRIDQRTQLHLR